MKFKFAYKGLNPFMELHTLMPSEFISVLLGILHINDKPDQVVEVLKELSDLAQIQKIELEFGLTQSGKVRHVTVVCYAYI